MAPNRRRRVSFAQPKGNGKGANGDDSKRDKDGAADEVTEERGSAATKRSRAVSFKESTSNGVRDEHSLLNEDDGAAGITAFDLKEELADGDTLTKEDGVIPRALADLAHEKSPSISSSSSAEPSADLREVNKQKSREHKIAADDGDWSDTGSGSEAERPSSPKRARLASTEAVVGDVICMLATRLRREETPAELVRRCGRAKDTGGLEKATELCLQLVEGGLPDVYETRREALLAKCREWNLRWESGGDKVHGPFDAGQMRAWGDAGYFSQDGNKAQVRVEGGKWWAAEGLFPR